MPKEGVKGLGDVAMAYNNAFTLTPYVDEIINRALLYLNAGYPIHLKGPAGTGKTVLAMYIAKLIGKPTTMIFGNEAVETSDMIGSDFGYTKRVVEDNYIHSVHKIMEDYEQKWIDGRIINACEKGYVLIYDEFTRSRPETNNILLSVLEEKVLELPINYYGSNKLLKIHPDFKIIFTSNPEEYTGVYKSQDALVDRFITLELDFPDQNSEVNIAVANSGLSLDKAVNLVSIVRSFREINRSKFLVSLRDSIKLCKIIKTANINIAYDNDVFRKVCIDVLTSGISVQKTNIDRTKIKEELNTIIKVVLMEHK
ncbi:gas vesicle protein GvpN [Anaerosacchariphilus polymeriproducens]|uniref:Gas vesicle protein GvpN n=1 Tax=Anaerosacchariphilus polymeriproducens TaxID=1812858 RepID=A0A371AZJ8_9FIRM|nr:gas vesicle protein GvpN [Anaerosacchariphilus polymeriproducens]RDU24973.1 gas vesicle protein GvpN [Anaerosacchariphilus polymeriproducens]